MTDTIQFDVRGLPMPQGNLRAFVIRGGPRKGRAVLSNKNPGPLKDWRHAVASAAQAHAPPQLWEGPIQIGLDFRLPQPRSRRTTVGRGKARRRVRILPDRRPDLDKLLRAILDSLTMVVFRDDAQVVAIRARKTYGVPGVKVRVERILEGIS